MKKKLILFPLLCVKYIKIVVSFLWVFLAFICALSSYDALAGEWEIIKIGEGAVPKTIKWCHQSRKIVWQSAMSGIHIADVNNGEASVKMITSSWQDSNPFCSPDGRYVFFFDTTSYPAIPKYYDISTKKIQLVNGLDKQMIFSLDMQLALTTAGNARQITLPWGKQTKVIHINPSLHGYFVPRIFSISPNGKKALLLFVKIPSKGSISKEMSFAIFDVKNSTISLLSSLEHVAYARFSVDGNYLYVSTLTNFQDIQNGGALGVMDLYRLEVDKLSGVPVRIATGLSEFDVTKDRIVLLVNASSRSKLFLADLNGQHVQLIGEYKWEIDQIDFSEEGNSIFISKVVPDETDGPEGPPITRDVYYLSEK